MAYKARIHCRAARQTTNLVSKLFQLENKLSLN